jgi:fructose/tagatose bisphosphate aldolase
MPLESISRLMDSAKRGRYAVGYFESWSLDSVQGVIDAAERTRSPIIIGFNGEFLCQRMGATREDLTMYAAMGNAAAAKTNVPCGFIFNECSDDAWVERAITVGFNLVMLADPAATPEEYARRVARLSAMAHSRGVAVEAELDEATAHDDRAAVHFVAVTGADLLAVEVGNEEIKLRGRAPLDLDLLEGIHKRVDTPLVLHGGTGIEDDSLKAAIGLGVRKVNYGTYMKQRYLKAFRGALQSQDPNPHALLGGGSETDLMEIGRNAVRDAVLERIELLGCCGRA